MIADAAGKHLLHLKTPQAWSTRLYMAGAGMDTTAQQYGMVDCIANKSIEHDSLSSLRHSLHVCSANLLRYYDWNHKATIVEDNKS